MNPAGDLSELVIRSATGADVPALLPLVQAVCDFHEALDPRKFGFLPDVARRYGSWLPQRAADARSVLLIAEVGDAAAGFLVAEVLDEIPIYRVKEYGFIHDIWVQPAFRRFGIGRRLVGEAMRRFAAMGIEQVRGDTAEANEPARAMLAEFGFGTSTREMLAVVAAQSYEKR